MKDSKEELMSVIDFILILIVTIICIPFLTIKYMRDKFPTNKRDSLNKKKKSK